MIPVVIVVVDERRNRLFQLPGEGMMLQTDHILHGPVVALDFALGLGVIRGAMRVLEAMFGQSLAEVRVCPSMCSSPYPQHISSRPGISAADRPLRLWSPLAWFSPSVVP